MSFDLAVWNTSDKLTDSQATSLYRSLCDGDISQVTPIPAIDDFYREITSRHPEPNDVPDDRLDDTDFCPWSNQIDRSDGHVIVSSVWSKADYVAKLVFELAAKHGLIVFDPQEGKVFYLKNR